MLLHRLGLARHKRQISDTKRFQHGHKLAETDGSRMQQARARHKMKKSLDASGRCCSGKHGPHKAAAKFGSLLLRSTTLEKQDPVTCLEKALQILGMPLRVART